MDRIDALVGTGSERLGAMRGLVLAESEDKQLQEFVGRAAEQLEAPIALVSLVLEHVQYFRAHQGLPRDLAVSRATDRNVSFCQFVVRDGALFEVRRASRDSRVPQELVVKYGIESYLGVPVRSRGQVVGSLCVLDTKPREFTDEHRRLISQIAQEVSTRLEVLASLHTYPRTGLLSRATLPALATLRTELDRLRILTSTARLASTELSPALRVFEQWARDGEASGPMPAASVLRSTRVSLVLLDESLDDLDMLDAKVEAILGAMEDLLLPRVGSTPLRDALEASLNLASDTLRSAGKVELPQIRDCSVATPRPVAIALIAATVTALASLAHTMQRPRTIKIGFVDGTQWRSLVFSMDGAHDVALEATARRLRDGLARDQDVQVMALGGSLRLGFVATPDEAPPRESDPALR